MSSSLVQYQYIENKANEMGFFFSHFESPFKVYKNEENYLIGFCVPCRRVYAKKNGKSAKAQVVKNFIQDAIELLNSIQ